MRKDMDFFLASYKRLGTGGSFLSRHCVGEVRRLASNANLTGSQIQIVKRLSAFSRR
jgi:hypothetical protein